MADRVEELEEPVETLLRDVKSSRNGLNAREAEHRLAIYGPNVLQNRARVHWPADLARQLIHPLALLLWGAAGLALVARTQVLAEAIAAVIVLNAALAFIQERRAERAVSALAEFLPAQVGVRRDGEVVRLETAALVPGDVVVVEEGDAISADARLLTGAVEVDASTLTGESEPVERWAVGPDDGRTLLSSRHAVFSGTWCVSGHAEAVVLRTGMHTELGRIATLTQRTGPDQSPLERQVRCMAWLIAGVAIAAGVLFFPVGLAAGLSVPLALVFAIGLLVANVPEGLLPTITLALAVAVRELSRRGALVKRLSAVETLGSTDVICTDKTGTLTLNRMRAVHLYGADLEVDWLATAGPPPTRLLEAMARCSTAELSSSGNHHGDPTETAILAAARTLGADVGAGRRDRERQALFRFDPTLRLMSTLDVVGQDLAVLHTKGAPEQVLARCDAALRSGAEVEINAEDRRRLLTRCDELAHQGLRLIAFADRRVDVPPDQPSRAEMEEGLTLLGLVALEDPPRPEVADAVRACHEAGIRIHVITGDHGYTAAAIARQVGIGVPHQRVVDAQTLRAMSDPDLDLLLAEPAELVFARSEPEAKLRIAQALRSLGHVVAMTGDGVNDAPALRRADIGVAMGRSGTEVAREAATMVLTDDNFASIVAAIGDGRRVYANIRKFILYIFVHAVPEVVPFLLFALAGGLVPLPLGVLQILAIDLGTDILPAQALGREEAEPDAMRRPPRRQTEGLINRRLLLRAWGRMGAVSAALVLTGFFFVLVRSGWRWGAPTGPGTPLHHGYLEATTMTFAGIVCCQIGAAFAARTDRASLFAIGVLRNRLLLAGIAVELVFAAALVYLPPLQGLLGTAALPVTDVLLLLAFGPVVWGVDELARLWARHFQSRRGGEAPSAQAVSRSKGGPVAVLGQGPESTGSS